MRKILLLWLLLGALGASAQTLEGAWTGKLDLGVGRLTIVFHMEKGKVTMDSPDQGARGIPVNVNVLTADSLDVSVPQLAIRYAAGLQDGELRGTFSQAGHSLPLSLQADEKKANRPQTPTTPYPYDTEEVSIRTRSGAVLGGTLSRPTNITKGQTPIVLMLTGSGQQDRDETMFGHKPFLIIADHLARCGIASLRLDDRGVGASTLGDAAKLTTRDFAEDAEDVLNYLRSLGQYGKTGVLGHSEGASIGFMLGGKGKTDFIVSLAGCGVKGDSALAAQVNRIMQLSGQPGHITAREYALQPAVAENVWLKAFCEYDPTSDLMQTVCPVFALNGSKDVQVVESVNQKAIASALLASKSANKSESKGENKSASKKNKTKSYDGLNHLFQHCATGLPAEYGEIEETISVEVLQDIAEWINSVK